ncbi:MAG: flavodoxin family protein [Deltaproteobacteria bacterium]|nr:flavodoxin family protein [Deltaproteobacteria bacterium]
MVMIGISSSPNIDGNVDRMIQYILKRSGKPTFFVNLSNLLFSPCRACAHLCAKDNLCKIEDDLKPLYTKIIQADSLILGRPSYFNDTNGFMRVFLERLWSLRHLKFPLQGKPYYVIAVGGIQTPYKAIESVKSRMDAYRASYQGSVAFNSNIIPCFTCGFGTKCSVGASQYVYGEETRKNLEITEESFKKWEDCPETKEKVDKIIRDLSKKQH